MVGRKKVKKWRTLIISFRVLFSCSFGFRNYVLPLAYKPLWNPLPSKSKSCHTEICSKREEVNFCCIERVKCIVISTPFVSFSVTDLFLNGGVVWRNVSCHITVLYWKGTPVCEFSIGLYQVVIRLEHLEARKHCWQLLNSWFPFCDCKF